MKHSSCFFSYLKCDTQCGSGQRKTWLQTMLIVPHIIVEASIFYWTTLIPVRYSHIFFVMTLDASWVEGTLRQNPIREVDANTEDGVNINTQQETMLTSVTRELCVIENIDNRKSSHSTVHLLSGALLSHLRSKLRGKISFYLSITFFCMTQIKGGKIKFCLLLHLAVHI